ncbi:MAG: nucleotidyltransferase domain-containing protein [Chitinispirillales bacterium]|jgi:type I restriction enzyme S subunit|nr:nucleotidyltransferase domain-containing protein [Chitinispirillales bacterium]
MVHVSEKEMNIITDILSKHAARFDVLAFGPRYNGTNWRYSDLDLAFVRDGGLDMDTRSRLADAFSESDLPFRVDIVDYNAASPEFRAIVDGGNERIFSDGIGIIL